MILLPDLFRAASMEVADKVSVPSTPILGIECDSRKVQKGFLFVAISGTRMDGREFIQEALERGAVAIVSEGETVPDCYVPYARVDDARMALARLSVAFYNFPSRQMGMIGITGTNGKTTTSFLIEHLLNRLGESTGMIGTISHRYAGQTISAQETTPSPIAFQSLLARMRDAGCHYVVSEVSSHALDQRRVAGIDFRCAAFLNLTQDHLDYHKSLERYFAAKALLFSSLSRTAFALLNADDDWVIQARERTHAQVRTFGVDRPADYRAENIQLGDDATTFTLRHNEASYTVQLPLIGRHNVYNSLAALAICDSLGFGLAKTVGLLRDFPGVPGRLEAVQEGQDFKVFVDFAHTPDGLLNVLKALSGYKKNKLYVVFGCGGDRDRTKRPQMAKIASQFCDYVFVTSDNPRSEDPRSIALEVAKGFPEAFKNYSVVVDRRKALREALMKARTNDIVLLAGKGHERGQIIKGETIPYSDFEEAQKVLQGR